MTTTDTIHTLIDQINAIRHGEIPLSFSTHTGRIYRVNYGPARDKSYYQAYRLRDILAYLRAVKRRALRQRQKDSRSTLRSLRHL